MAAYTMDKDHKTISVATTGDTVATRGDYVRVRNMGANVISFSEDASPTGAVTAGAQSSLNPVPTTGTPDEAILRPNTTYYFKAATGATLACFDKVYGLPEFVQANN